MRAFCLSAGAVLLSLTAAHYAPADEFRQSQVQVILSQATETGSPIFNGGDRRECYYFYRDTLRSVLPLLRDRRDLKDQIEAALWRAEHHSSWFDKAWILRRAIDNTLAELN